MFSEIAYSCQIKENEEKENVFNVFNLFNLFKKNEMSTSAPNRTLLIPFTKSGDSGVEDCCTFLRVSPAPSPASRRKPLHDRYQTVSNKGFFPLSHIFSPSFPSAYLRPSTMSLPATPSLYFLYLLLFPLCLSPSFYVPPCNSLYFSSTFFLWN